jgi:hypothetical protein
MYDAQSEHFSFLSTRNQRCQINTINQTDIFPKSYFLQVQIIMLHMATKGIKSVKLNSAEKNYGPDLFDSQLAYIAVSWLLK